jgi:hypothetical protein
MLSSPHEQQALAAATAAASAHALTASAQAAARNAEQLEAPLAAVETALAELSLALQRNDLTLLDRSAHGLHHALAAAVKQFTHAAKNGGVPAPLRHRLALASAQVASQREALARATSSLDRAMDVLIPRQVPGSNGYGSTGHGARSVFGGSLIA